MQVKSVNLSDLKFNLETWRRELRFHYDEMDTFQDKLEETVSRGIDQDAQMLVENFQNRLLLEKAAIAKLKHRCKSLIRNPQLNQNGDADKSLGEDMRRYMKMHYDLKEEMMEFFVDYLPK